MRKGKGYVPGYLEDGTDPLENGRVHYLGRGKFVQPKPNIALREKYGISSHNLKKRVIREGEETEARATQFPNWGKHVRGII